MKTVSEMMDYVKSNKKQIAKRTAVVIGAVIGITAVTLLVKNQLESENETPLLEETVEVVEEQPVIETTQEL